MTAVRLAGHTGDVNSTDLTGDTSNVNSTDNPNPGTIARTSSHYRGSPGATAQSPQQIRPLVIPRGLGGVM